MMSKLRKKEITEYDPKMQELLQASQRMIEAEDTYKALFDSMFIKEGPIKSLEDRIRPANWKEAKIGDKIRSLHNIYKRVK